MPRLRRADIAVTGLLLAGVLFVLRSAGQTPDGLSYAIAARDGVDLFHPHHLLYIPAIRVVHLLTGAHDPLLAGVLHNLAWLVVLGIGARAVARGVGWGPQAAFLSAAVLLATRGVVFYATHVETYLPALACLTMFAAAWLRTDRGRFAPAVWLALAVLYHQTNVLVVLPALAASDRLRRDIFATLIPAGLFVWAFYVLGWWHETGGRDLMAWLFTYLHADVPAWGDFAHFSWAGWRELALNQLRMVVPVPNSLATPAALLLAVGLSGLVVHHTRRHTRRAERRFGLVFLATYLPFFLWWIPADPDFFLASLLPLWLLALLLVDDLPVLQRGSVWAMAAIMLVAGNLVFVAVPMSQDPGPEREIAHRLHWASPPGAALVVGYGLQQELLYFTPRREVFEGDALGWRVAAGDTSGVPEPPVVVGRDYVALLLARWRPTDEALLRRLLGYGGNAKGGRAHQILPDGVGLVVTAASDTTAEWSQKMQILRSTFAGPLPQD